MLSWIISTWKYHKGILGAALVVVLALAWVVYELFMAAFIGWLNDRLLAHLGPLMPAIWKWISAKAMALVAGMALTALAMAIGFIQGERYRPVPKEGSGSNTAEEAAKETLREQGRKEAEAKIAEWLSVRNEVCRATAKARSLAARGRSPRVSRHISANLKLRMREAYESATNARWASNMNLSGRESDSIQPVEEFAEELLVVAREVARKAGLEPDVVAPLPND